MNRQFEWDLQKAAVNAKKHGVTFEEAITIFDDPRAVFKRDEEHSNDEDRWFVLGISEKGRLLLTVTVDRDGRIRIISARKATSKEIRIYAESNDQTR